MISKHPTTAGAPANAATSELVEQFGAIMEADEYPRVAGRLFGLLLLTEDTCSLEELAEQLSVSKASISINIRMLEQRGIVERVSRPGDRRDHYRITPDVLARTVEQRLARWRRMRAVVSSATASRAIRNKVIHERLDELNRAFEHMHDATARALDEWRQRRGQPRVSNVRNSSRTR